MDYSNKRVIVAGGGGAGIGAACARLAAELGAEVFVLDLRAPREAAPKTEFMETDLGDPSAIVEAVARIGEPVHALFNCQGVSGAAAGSTVATVMRVNFLGVRQLTEAVVPLMPPGAAVASVASAGGLGWPRRLDRIQGLLDADGFEEGLRWVEAHGDYVPQPFPEAYAFSKQSLIVWTMRRAVSAIADRGVRVNCSSPGSVRTPMAPDFPAEGVAEIHKLIGRESAPDEQAWPLLFLNSGVAGYVNGVNLVVDGGYSAARTLGLPV
jgi:NAD(P)-dependent dehydrogenase (short-subunit alcohol dehydrogenase family)